MVQVHLPLLAKAQETAASSRPWIDPMDLDSYPIGSSVKDSIQRYPERLLRNMMSKRARQSALSSIQRPPL
ncbi:hypothetical protein BDQ94DRAFT_143004 [Aspergillus welwitschiae]|uniref:Uncharacterized protein n=1 Tax=Aspergillus welwitschiae TaxID=1341132 RepID=A0A3F3Q468_9EURO|nr:hypothetical protein BDQ94DRAFT_143004 [Aspergillus welwitschiae]RDH33973.1 hypothetical protein BDQ94DRAFT_143004 [Aspergillus welwitschiae]